MKHKLRTLSPCSTGNRRQAGERNVRVWLIRERRARGWTQERLAQWLGCSVDAVQLWESGRRRVPGWAVAALEGLRGQLQIVSQQTCSFGNESAGSRAGSNVGAADLLRSAAADQAGDVRELPDQQRLNQTAGERPVRQGARSGREPRPRAVGKRNGRPLEGCQARSSDLLERAANSLGASATQNGSLITQEASAAGRASDQHTGGAAARTVASPVAGARKKAA